MKQFYHQRAFRLHVVLRKINRQLDQVGNARRIDRIHTREIGRHIGHDGVRQPALQGLLQLCKDTVFTEITLDVRTA